MGFLSVVAGAASTAALYHYVRNVRSVAPPALLRAVAKKAIDAQQVVLPISPAAAARYAALLTNNRKLASKSNSDASPLRPLLARCFFESHAFQPERAFIGHVLGKDVSREKLKGLAWTPGDRFGLWTVAPCDSHDALLLDWELAGRAWGKQMLLAELVGPGGGNALRVTLSSPIQIAAPGDSDVSVARATHVGNEPQGTVDGPVESLRQASLHVVHFLHILYARVLVRSVAETLRREL